MHWNCYSSTKPLRNLSLRRWCLRHLQGILVFLLAGVFPPVYAQSALHHDIRVLLSPHTSHMEVSDTITLPESLQNARELTFSLNAALTLHDMSGDGFSIEREGSTVLDNVADAGRDIAPSTQYRLRLTQPGSPITFHYSGTINSNIQQLSAEYAQSFSSTTGIIAPQGVYLDHSTVWLPDFSAGLMRFELQVDFAEGASQWLSVSQGDLLDSNHWQSTSPMEEVYLVAGNFALYETESDGVSLQAYLRQEDPNLATRYLDATARYLALYEEMLGEYPFSKFALVENFWETGYGMPSFTLLGEQIIRFPFILETSYPHEILHNWWGNSVFPDYDTGNWSEGLTAYLADHLFQEMDNAGPEYRKDMLGRYRSAVSESADFPLRDFTSRNSAATQAVGYGKTLMLWHMLRMELGDALFLQGLRTLYEQRQFQRTGYAEIEALFSSLSGKDLTPFFAQWVQRTGAPELSVAVTAAAERAELVLTQTQNEDVYTLKVPVALFYEGEETARIIQVAMSDRRATVPIDEFSRLQAVVVDPRFDVFRRLDATEMPPTLRQLFGAEKIQFIIPQENRAQWIAMAEFFSADPAISASLVNEEEFEGLPIDQSVWILGRSNVAREFIEAAVEDYGVRFSEAGLSMLGSELPFANRSTVLTAAHPQNAELTLGWIHADSLAAMPGLTEKLPHYGKYSYLSFIGNEPSNDVKGQWESPESPLLWRRPALADALTLAPLPELPPLAVLPPKYLPSGFAHHIDTLASANMEGRGLASEGLGRAADYIEAQFNAIGLQAPESGVRQRWQAQGSDGTGQTGINLVGLIPGTDEALRDAPLVVGAHYDHLGVQGADTYPGADDNASGVALLLEVARTLNRAFTPRRPIMFVAFSGEEQGLLGSRAFVATPPAPTTRQSLFAMINLDSVGRLEGRPLQVFGSESAYEWPFMAQGIGFTIGVASQFPAQSIAGSDHVSFLEAGIPAIHLFSGLHTDYHRPSDTPGKVDLAGMSDIALWLEEAIVYLANRDQPLRATLSKAPVRAPQAASGARAASLGTIPEFNYSGDGVQISGVTPGGAAEEAGLEAGDILLQFDETVLTDLQHYSNLIREAAPGDEVVITLRRGTEVLQRRVVLKAR